MIVHGDETLVLIDARGGRTQAFEISEPSGGHEQTLARHGLGAVKVHGETRTVLPRPHRSRPGQDADAFSPENLADQPARLRLLRRQQAVRRFDDRDRGPEPGERLSQLNADGTAADNGQ